MAHRERFAFDFDPGYERTARLFGVTPANAWIDVGDGALDAHFGHWRVRTDLGNIVEASVTGPYRFVKTAGPARLAVTDLGLTFATNGRRGVLLRFARRVAGIDPLALIRHGELTVTVADIDGFLEAVRRTGATGSDATRQPGATGSDATRQPRATARTSPMATTAAR